MRARIEVTKNRQGRVESGKIYAGRKVFSFSHDWDDDGHLSGIEFQGKDLPSPSELYHFMNDKFIERIRHIDLIDLISEIALIDNITNIGTIDQITRIKDAPFYRENVIANFGFETGDLTGWVIKGGTPTVMTGGAYSATGFNACLLVRAVGRNDVVAQALSRPVLSDDVVLFSITAATTAGNWNLSMNVYYTDGTSSNHTFACTTAWAAFPITPTAGKTIGGIDVQCAAVGASILVDSVDLITSTRMYLYAWDNAGSVWRKVLCDGSGYLYTKAAP